MACEKTACEFVDLAGELLPVIAQNLEKSVDEQIAAWQGFYARRAPSLPQRLYADYAEVDGGWEPIALQKVWPYLKDRMEKMHMAAESIRASNAEVCDRAASVVGLPQSVVIVSYVGIGNGAGWATTWESAPAVLLGLENIAELNWHRPAEIRKLLAHELGHLFMMSIRPDVQKLTEEPLTALYEEGFAQQYEHVTLGSETWGCASQDGWLEWCLSHEASLAEKYLQSLEDKTAWKRFFGSWFDVDGWKQTGYFLGCRFVQHLTHSHTLREVAALDAPRIRAAVSEFLRSLC